MDHVEAYRSHLARHRLALREQVALAERRASVAAELAAAQAALAAAEGSKQRVYDAWALDPASVSRPESVLQELSERRGAVESLSEALAALDRLLADREAVIEACNDQGNKVRSRAFTELAIRELDAIGLASTEPGSVRAALHRAWAATTRTDRFVRFEHWLEEIIGPPTEPQLRDLVAQLEAEHGLT
jgi:hypothetical protein